MEILNIKLKLTLSVKPFKGTGVPHFRSRLIQRGFKPSLNQEFVITFALFVQIPLGIT